MSTTMNKDTIIKLMFEDKNYREVCAKWMLDHTDTLAGPEGEPPRKPPITEDWESFQKRCSDWALECFGPDSVHSIPERFDRFLEEVFEFTQSCGIRKEVVLAMLDHVYNDKTPGEPEQELGGVMITLGVLCETIDLDITRFSELELTRIKGKIEEIREKNENKPRLHTSEPFNRSEPLNNIFASISENTEYQDTLKHIEAGKDAAVRNAAHIRIQDNI